MRRWRCTGLAVGAAAVLAACGGAAEPAPLFDFVAELPFAEVKQETAVIDVGTTTGREHLVDGWSGVDQSAGDANFAWGLGFASTVEFTVIEPRDRRLVLRGRPYAPDGSAPRWSLGVAVNGQPVTESAWPPETEQLEVVVPEAALRDGDNLLTLSYVLDGRGDDPFAAAGNAAATRDTVGTANAVAVGRNDQSRAVAWDSIEIRETRRHGEVAVIDDTSIELPILTRIDYYTRVPVAALLSIAQVGAWGDAEDIVLRVEIEAAGAAQPRRHYARLPVDGPVEIELPATGTTPVRISFMPTSATATGEAGVTLARPLLRLRDNEASAPAGATSTAGHDVVDRAAAAAPRPDVIVYLIDALRPDHLGAYGYRRDTSPNLDAFAAGAVLFDNAIANSAWTRSAVASVFTGLYPRSHGVLGRDDALPPDATTLAGLLRDAGYNTAAVATNGNVSPPFGFDTGFDSWEQLPEQRTEAIHQYSDIATARALEWLAAIEGGATGTGGGAAGNATGAAQRAPFFLYVHTTDPHEPYTPPSPFRERFVQPSDHGLFRPLQERVDPALAADPTLTREQINLDFIDLYDAEIAFNDAQFGILMDRLQEMGIYDDALIVVLADHGEAFLEHGKWGHGTSLYAEQINIPLLVKLPLQWVAAAAASGSEPAANVDNGMAARIVALSQQIDVLPTILAVAGVEIPSHVQGRSLLPAIVGDAQVHDSIVAELEMDGRSMDALRTPELKIIRYAPALYHGARSELFDPIADPSEHMNLSLRRPVFAGYLLSLLRRAGFAHVQLLAAARGTPSEEMLERLRALGYIR